MVSDIKGRIETEGIWKQGAEEYIWAEEERNNRRLEKAV
jgi:hypothetical protein